MTDIDARALELARKVIREFEEHGAYSGGVLVEALRTFYQEGRRAGREEAEMREGQAPSRSPAEPEEPPPVPGRDGWPERVTKLMGTKNDDLTREDYAAMFEWYRELFFAYMYRCRYFERAYAEAVLRAYDKGEE